MPRGRELVPLTLNIEAILRGTMKHCVPVDEPLRAAFRLGAETALREAEAYVKAVQTAMEI